MTGKVVRSTDRGQITLPKSWRSLFPTNNYLVEMYEDRLIVIPLNFGEVSGEEVLFDADRDNEGKGVSPDQMIRALKKIRHG